MNKVIIWAHKLHTSTHSYVQNGYYRAFKKLGWETHWVDTTDVDSVDVSNSVIFVEDSVKAGMPIRKDCKYITHHLPTQELVDQGIPYENIIKLGNYLPQEEIHEKVADLTYWDESTRSIYQCWGTDLLPDEIDTDDYVEFVPTRKKVNYVAML